MKYLDTNNKDGNPSYRFLRRLAVGILAASSLVCAQEAPPPADNGTPPPPQQQQEGAAVNNGWPAAGPQDTAPLPSTPAPPNGSAVQPPPPPAYGQPPAGSYGSNQNPYGSAPYAYPQAGQQPYYGPPPSYPPQQAPPPIPAEMTVSPGTFVTVRLNQQLSSNRNRPGDPFIGTLAEPVVVNGIVIAEPGETVGGVVQDVDKGNPAKLIVQLTQLTLVDGQNLPIQTRLVARRGPGFTGQDAGTIVGTTAIGAGIGAVADWGTGAAVGAGVGAVVGALITHNHPSVLYPEQILTFRIDMPANFSTQNAPQAFHYVQAGEYDRPPYQGQGPAIRTAAPMAPVYYGAYPYSWGYPYAYPYFGTGVGIYFGPSYRYHYPYYGRYYAGRYYRR